MKIRNCIGVMALALLLGGCSWPGRAYEKFKNTHTPFRMNPERGRPDSTVEMLKSDPPQERRKTLGRGATIAYLEFDDQGELWRLPGNGGSTRKGWGVDRHTQLAAVTEELRSQTAKGAVKTVIFIHGWNHNAEPGDSNLESFKVSLGKLAEISDVPIFGVYVGWRGTVGLRGVDVATREATATRVGGPSLLTCLRAIRTISDRKDGTSVLAIGHSFGAKILSKVTCDDLAVQIGTKIATPSATVSPFADTIILANTAESGAIPLQMMNLMRDYKVTYKTGTAPARDLPMVVAVTSYEDRAVHYLLPVWNKIARNYIALPHKGGATSDQIQDEALYNAMGFYGPLRSHKLHSEKTLRMNQVKWPNDGELRKLDWRDMLRDNVEYGKGYASKPGEPLRTSLTVTGDIAERETFEIKRLDKCDFEEYANGAIGNTTPFWFLQVHGFVSGGHNDVWNPNFTSLIVTLESMKARSDNKRKLTPTPQPTLKLIPAG